MTVAVTLFALLELYKQGEADVGAGRAVRRHRDRAQAAARAGAAGGGRMSELARIVEALLFLSPEPVAVADLAEALRAARRRSVDEALAELREALRARASAASSCARSPAAGRSPPTPSPRRPRAGCWPSRAPRR